VKRDPKHYHTGFDDGLIPIKSIEPTKAPNTDNLCWQMESVGLGGSAIGDGVRILTQMFTDKNMFTVLTTSGAMTPAGMGLIICDLIDRGYIQAVVSTGALITHGFVQSAGMAHFRHRADISDIEAYERGYNRIYNVIELEKNLDDAEMIVHEVLDKLNPYITLSSHLVTRELGRWLTENTEGRGILKSAFEMNVPVYIPAFTDSELGLDIALYNMRRVAEGKNPFNSNEFIDLLHFMELFNQQKKAGIFTIGGGVPRNWAQQIPPFLSLIESRMPKGEKLIHIKPKKYSAGVRICPESVEWGGLSGCPYTEGVAWGKFDPDGQYAEILTDATIIWPFIHQAVCQRLDKLSLRKVEKNFDLKTQIEEAEKLIEPHFKSMCP
jgi:deoxyhypusine synthase